MQNVVQGKIVPDNLKTEWYEFLKKSGRMNVFCVCVRARFL
jgi:hypothetical protein